MRREYTVTESPVPITGTSTTKVRVTVANFTTVKNRAVFWSAAMLASSSRSAARLLSVAARRAGRAFSSWVAKAEAVRGRARA